MIAFIDIHRGAYGVEPIYKVRPIAHRSTMPIPFGVPPLAASRGPPLVGFDFSTRYLGTHTLSYCIEAGRHMPNVTSLHRPDLGGNIRHGDVHTWAPYLWRYLIDRFAIDSMLDVGCGEGHAVKFFHRAGLFAHGIDGLIHNIQRAVIPIAHHDLLSGPYIMPVDLTWSCEVAEHIDPDRVEFYLDTLANGRIIAMTHAVPGQAGYHHVNCQPAEYWIDRICARGYLLSDDCQQLRTIAAKDETWNYFSRTGLVFLRL